jgi:hypothetical protein
LIFLVLAAGLSYQQPLLTPPSTVPIAYELCTSHLDSADISTSPGCVNAQLVSSLNSEDAGTLNMGAVFTNGFPHEYVNAALGANIASPEMAAKVAPVGTGANYGTDECRRKCGIKAISDDGDKPKGGDETSGNRSGNRR